MRSAERIRSLPPYLFAELDKKLAAKREAGADIISLGVGDPDLPTPDAVVEAMNEAVRDPAVHRYPPTTAARRSGRRSRAGTDAGSAWSSIRRTRSWR